MHSDERPRWRIRELVGRWRADDTRRRQILQRRTNHADQLEAIRRQTELVDRAVGVDHHAQEVRRRARWKRDVGPGNAHDIPRRIHDPSRDRPEVSSGRRCAADGTLLNVNDAMIELPSVKLGVTEATSSTVTGPWAAGSAVPRFSIWI